MRYSLLTLAATLAIGTTAFAASAPAPAVPTLTGPRPSAVMIPSGDSNKDGKLSKAEWAAMQDKRFSAMDTNHDGQVTADEFDQFVAGEVTRGNKK